MRTLSIMVISVVLCACTTSKKTLHSNNTSKQVVFQKIIDTVERVRIDSSSVMALLECDSIGRVRLSTMEIKDGEIAHLQASLKNNRIDVKVAYKEIERVREKIVVDTLYVNNSIVEREQIRVSIPLWMWGLMVMGVVYLAKISIKLYRRRWEV